MRRKRFSYLAPIFLLLALLLAGPWLLTGGGRLPRRVYVDGMGIGGWRISRAELSLRLRARHYLRTPVLLYYERLSWRLVPEELGVGIDTGGVLAQASPLAQGLRGWPRALALSLGLRRLDLRFEPRLKPRDLAAALAEKVAPAVESPPCNAVFDRFTGRILPEKPGWRIDYPRTALNVARAAMAGGARRARLVMLRLKPATVAASLSSLHLRHLLATYATSAAGSTAARLHNIGLVAAKLNGLVLEDGEIFSLNAATGPRDLLHGYREALEIVRQEYVPGIGGGSCQVASTLYNTVLLAGLPVVLRASHSLPPSYVPLGRDATVYYPSVDFRFANRTRGHLMILAALDGETLRLSLLGEAPPAGHVWVVSQVLAKLEPPVVAPDDPRATKNKDGAPGYRVLVTRLFGDPETPLRTEIISEDVYHPVPRVEEGVREIDEGRVTSQKSRVTSQKRQIPSRF